MKRLKEKQEKGIWIMGNKRKIAIMLIVVLLTTNMVSADISKVVENLSNINR